MASFFESESRRQKQAAQRDSELAGQLFQWSLGFFLIQLTFAIVVGVASVRNQRLKPGFTRRPRFVRQNDDLGEFS